LMVNSFNPDGPKVRKIRLVWLLSARMPNGQPYLATKLYSLSFHPKAALRRDVEAWIGPLTTAQRREFDVETLIGRSCLVSIVHATKPDGRIFANVASVLKLPAGMRAPELGDYVRKADRSRAPSPFRGRQGSFGNGVQSVSPMPADDAGEEQIDQAADPAELDTREAYEQELKRLASMPALITVVLPSSNGQPELEIGYEEWLAWQRHRLFDWWRERQAAQQRERRLPWGELSAPVSVDTVKAQGTAGECPTIPPVASIDSTPAPGDPPSEEESEWLLF
jgi:hypothetical protein